MPLNAADNRDREFTPLVPLRLGWVGVHACFRSRYLIGFALISAREWAAVIDVAPEIQGSRGLWVFLSRRKGSGRGSRGSRGWTCIFRDMGYGACGAGADGV